MRSRSAQDFGATGFSQRRRSELIIAQRRTAAAFPVGALHRGSVDLEVVGSGDDDHFGHRASPHALEDRLCEEALLRGAEPRRRTGRKNDDL